MAYYVYILASKPRGTLYIGVTNNIARRMLEHKQGLGSKFTQKYAVTRLVYLETHDKIGHAIQREKTMKEWRRRWKVDLIEKDNPDWCDLFNQLNA